MTWEITDNGAGLWDAGLDAHSFKRGWTEREHRLVFRCQGCGFTRSAFA